MEKRKKGHLGKAFAYVYSIFIFLFLYAPIAVLIVLSFNDSKLRSSWGGFTFKWYISLFKNEKIMLALLNTIIISIIAATVATVIGTLAALAISNMRSREKKVLMSLTYIPMLNADIVTGVSLFLLFLFIGMKMGFLTLLLAHITFNIPYVVLSVLPKIKQMNPNLLDAAMDLGMHPRQALIKVVMPEIMPGIVSGFLLALTMSIDDFVISFFTTGPGINTLSIEIYTMTRRGINPEINALSTIMFVVVFVMLLIVNFRNKDKKSATMINIGSQ